MPRREREPQSYGSEADWTTGRTGQRLHEPGAAPPPGQEEFYDDTRESETNADYQGGLNSPVQLAENDPAGGRTTDEALPQSKITTREGGAKRDSFFRRRDYD